MYGYVLHSAEQNFGAKLCGTRSNFTLQMKEIEKDKFHMM